MSRQQNFERPALAGFRRVRTLDELQRLRRELKGLVVVSYTAVWCGPCTRAKPEIVAAAASREARERGAIFIDVERDDDGGRFLKDPTMPASTVPQLHYYRDGALVHTQLGVAAGSVVAAIKTFGRVTAPAAAATPAPGARTDFGRTTLAGFKRVRSYDELRRVLGAAPGLVVVAYTATWCGHCRHAKPKLVAAAAARDASARRVTFVDVELEEGDVLDRNLDLESAGVPQLHFYRGGRLLARHRGVSAARLAAAVRAL